jgi:hypothetical protein
VAHRVKLEMPWKLKGRNVSFAMVETIPTGENRESLPTIGEEGLTSKHDIFYWRLQDWNGDSRGICEKWPRPRTVRYEDFSRRKRFEIAMTLMSYPSKPMLKNQAAFSFAPALQNVGVPGHSIQEGRLTHSSGSSPLSGGESSPPPLLSAADIQLGDAEVRLLFELL